LPLFLSLSLSPSLGPIAGADEFLKTHDRNEDTSAVDTQN